MIAAKHLPQGWVQIPPDVGVGLEVRYSIEDGPAYGVHLYRNTATLSLARPGDTLILEVPWFGRRDELPALCARARRLK